MSNICDTGLMWVNYANVAWGGTYTTKSKELSSQRNHAIRIILDKGNLKHTKHLLRSNKVLIIYKLNILNVTTFIYKFNQKGAWIYSF